MRNLKSFLVATLVFTFVALPAFSVTSAHNLSAAVQQSGTLERGYRTGYSDGYQQGYRDSLEPGGTRQDVRDEDIESERGYNSAYGSLEDYRDGYVQGFRSGYDAGFERQPFSSNPPSTLSGRARVDDDDDTLGSSSAGQSGGSVQSSGNVQTGGSVHSSSGRVTTAGGNVRIPSDTVMRVELLTNLSTEASQVGDRFQARVLDPVEYEGAMIDGRVTRVKRPGKVKGTAELQLSFDQIRLTDNRWADIEAQIIEVVDTAGSGVGDVDEEGGVKGRNSTKDKVVKIGAGTAIGAIIGAIAGGGKGAAIGAVIGGAIGTGGAISSRGSEIHLPLGQQLRIRTSRDTRIQ